MKQFDIWITLLGFRLHYDRDVSMKNLSQHVTHSFQANQPHFVTPYGEVKKRKTKHADNQN